ILGYPTSAGSARTSATSAAMLSTSDAFAIRAARPPPTQVAFEIPRARRIRLRSPPYWATTRAATDRTTAASVGSRCSSSECVSASGTVIGVSKYATVSDVTAQIASPARSERVFRVYVWHGADRRREQDQGIRWCAARRFVGRGTRRRHRVRGGGGRGEVS